MELNMKNILIAVAVAVVVTAVLHHLVKMNHLMSKGVVPLAVFLITYHLLNEYHSEQRVEEGLSPQFLEYGHTNFDGAWGPKGMLDAQRASDQLGEDDPDSTRDSITPADFPQVAELKVPRQNEALPHAFNARNVEVPYAYYGSGVQPQFTDPSMAPDAACAVGVNNPNACNGCGLCSQPNVVNPCGVVAPTPGPQWMPQRASAVQARLVNGDFVPATSAV